MTARSDTLDERWPLTYADGTPVRYPTSEEFQRYIAQRSADPHDQNFASMTTEQARYHWRMQFQGNPSPAQEAAEKQKQEESPAAARVRKLEAEVATLRKELKAQGKDLDSMFRAVIKGIAQVAHHANAIQYGMTVARPEGKVTSFTAEIDKVFHERSENMPEHVKPLVQRIEDLERSQMKFAGVYTPGERYARNSLVTKGGSLWCALMDTDGPPPGSGWQLAVKDGAAK
jgi:hypothetical protein